MPVAASSRPRVSVDGKFFRLGEKKFYVKGVAYGPFAPNAAGQPFASPEQTDADFDPIPPDVVRWSGTKAVADFIDDLILEAKRVDSECLCTFTNYPPTEFLRPQAVDFVCFNIYLHQPQPFRNYLARLQMLAESKPLLLGEAGIDSLRDGEARKCEMLQWQIELVFRGGLAGADVRRVTED